MRLCKSFSVSDDLCRIGSFIFVVSMLLPSLALAQDAEGEATTSEEQSAHTPMQEGPEQTANEDDADDQLIEDEEPIEDAEGAGDQLIEDEEPVEDAEGAGDQPIEDEELSEEAEGAGDQLIEDEESATEGARQRPYWIRAVGEAGMLAVLSNRIQFGRNGTYFNYREDGSADNLYFFGRLGIELGLYRHHQIIFVYQPLFLRTEGVLTDSIVVDDLEYPEGTPMSYRYDFPFYRISYLYDFFGQRDLEVAIGLTLQIRNANISFASRDGELFRDNRNVGLVPALKLRVTYYFPNGVWIGTEIDGIYAPVSRVIHPPVTRLSAERARCRRVWC